MTVSRDRFTFRRKEFEAHRMAPSRALARAFDLPCAPALTVRPIGHKPRDCELFAALRAYGRRDHKRGK